MHVGEKVSVEIDSFEGTSKSTSIHPVRKTVKGRVEYVHPLGRYATVRVPAGYCVTIYPDRRKTETEKKEEDKYANDRDLKSQRRGGKNRHRH